MEVDTIFYWEFIEGIRDEVQAGLGAGVRVELNSVLKNNSVQLDGLMMVREGSNLSPTIYLNQYYEDFKNGRAYQEIVGEVLRVFKERCVDENIDVSFFTDYEQARKLIAFKLINFESNRELLERIPHICFLDLAIVFYILLESERFGAATILIHHSHLELWEISLEEVYEAAKNNTPRLMGWEIKPMEEVIQEIVRQDFPIDEQPCYQTHRQGGGNPEGEGTGLSMYVLTNRARINGASCMLYQDILEEFSKSIADDLYILPSSVHEVIIVPAKKRGQREHLEDVVREMNSTQLDREEVLSDNVYYFSQEEGCISL